MNITTCNLCGMSIGFGEGTFQAGVHDECYLAPKCKCGRLLFKGDTYEKDGGEFCSIKCLENKHEKSR